MVGARRRLTSALNKVLPDGFFYAAGHVVEESSEESVIRNFTSLKLNQVKPCAKSELASEGRTKELKKPLISSPKRVVRRFESRLVNKAIVYLIKISFTDYKSIEAVKPGIEVDKT